MKTRPPFVDVGLQYADQGIAVLPLETVVRGLCTCGNPKCDRIGKHPQPRIGKDDASKDPAQIELWGEMYPNANIGIAAEQSGLLLADIDPRYGGAESLASLICNRGELPRTVEDRTGSGGTHYYFKRPDEKLKGKAIPWPGVEVIAAGYVVSPWSMHANGKPYSWVNRPGRVKIAMPPEWLFEPLIDQSPAAVVNLIPDTHGIPRAAWHILAGTTKKIYGAYGDRQDNSAAEYTAVLALVNQGWEFDRIYEKFRELAHSSSHFAKLQKSNEREARQWLQRVYKAASQWSTTNESTTRQDARRFIAVVQYTSFPGRSGEYTQAVALAHGAIALRSGRTEYQAGERELAERAGCSRKAVRRANAHLVEIGAIKRTLPYSSRVPTLATRWELGTMQRVYQSPQALNPNPVREWSSTAYLAHDAFRRAGLGKSAAQLFGVLQAGPRLTGELVKESGRGWRTVIGALERMRELGMVRSERQGHTFKWFAVECVNLDDIADKLGPDVQGIGKRQRDRHERERDRRIEKMKQERAEGRRAASA